MNDPFSPELKKAYGEAITLARIMEGNPAFDEGVQECAALLTARFHEVIARIAVLSGVAEDASE